MTGEPSPIASLRRVLADRPASSPIAPYVLPADSAITIGRDPRCHVVIDSTQHVAVSRRHVEVRPQKAGHSSLPTWWVCDLDSFNGTYLNGKRLRGCQLLKTGDHIALGQSGPEFIFEYHPYQPLDPLAAREFEGTLPPRSQAAPPERSSDPMSVPSPAAIDREETVTFTQLFPIASTGRDLTQKAYLVPGAVTVGYVVALFLAVGRSQMVFNLLTASYIALAAYFFIYRLCGKRKPWWILLATAIATAGLITSPLLPLLLFVFRQVLPGQLPAEGQPIHFLVLLIKMFIGAGLMEELLKVLPLFFVMAIARLLPGPLNQRIGIWEPLDGILLGAASAVGFTLMETLGQYVPSVVQNATLQGGGLLSSQEMGLQLLIPRILGLVCGHLAYSGYFGYFIGLCVLKPKQSGLILLVGYGTAAALHALWNAMGMLSPVALSLVGVASYAFLAAAILKARRLSPTRSQNFATQLKG